MADVVAAAAEPDELDDIDKVCTLLHSLRFLSFILICTGPIIVLGAR